MGSACTRFWFLVALLCAPVTAFSMFANTAVTYIGSDGTRRIHDFAVGSGGIVENYFDGATWHWISHPKPSDVYASLSSLAAITYEEDGTQRIYVFGVTGNSHSFVVLYFNGVQWQWAKLPTSGFLEWRGNIAALTYLDELGQRRIELFANTDINSHDRLIRTWWDGSSWQSTSHHSPGDSRVDGPIAAVTYSERGARQIHVYCNVTVEGSGTRKLYSYSWQRGAWTWTDLGAQHFGARSAVTYVDANDTRRIQIFGSRYLNDSLAIYEKNGSSWSLVDLGKPEFQDFGPDDASAISYLSNTGERQVFVATTFNDHLYFKRHNGTNWSSFAGFADGATQFADDPTWVFYPDARSGNDTLQMFVSGASALMRHRWNGTSWQSFNQGAP